MGLGIFASVLEYLVPCLHINDTQRDDKTKVI